MLHSKSKKIVLPLFFSLLMTLCCPGLTYAEESYDTGDVAASRAAEQRAAIAKRKERIRKEKEADAQKAAETQQAQPAETQQPAQEQAEKPAAQ